MKDIDKVDIIIVTYNAKKLLQRCISSIRKHTKKGSYLITVVDNCSSDGSIDLLKREKDINFIKNRKNLGFPKAINRGIRNTYNNLIACVDDDVEVKRGWLEGLVKYIKNQKVGIVGCKIILPNGRIHAAEYRLKPISVVGKNEIDVGQKEYIREVDGLIGPCWLMKRELIKKVGYFDERFFPCQHEDIDYCLRTRLAGYKIIYNGNINVIHHNVFRDKSQSDKGWKKLLKKWHNFVDFPLRDSHLADKYNAKGYEFLLKRDFTKAYQVLKKVEAINKEFSMPFYLGISELALGNYKQAIKYFERVLKFMPEHDRSLMALGGVYEKLKKYKKAINNYKKALKINPYPSLYYKLGYNYRELKKFNLANVMFKKTLRLITRDKTSFKEIFDGHTNFSIEL
jgi:GT2 family glycosyltransferase